jgi:hypothetical protein
MESTRDVQAAYAWPGSGGVAMRQGYALLLMLHGTACHGQSPAASAMEPPRRCNAVRRLRTNDFCILAHVCVRSIAAHSCTTCLEWGASSLPRRNLDVVPYLHGAAQLLQLRCTRGFACTPRRVNAGFRRRRYSLLVSVPKRRDDTDIRSASHSVSVTRRQGQGRAAAQCKALHESGTSGWTCAALLAHKHDAASKCQSLH